MNPQRSGGVPPKPTAPKVSTPPPWEAIAADPDFKKLLAAKARFILLATLFFVAYYFTLPVLVGWYPDLMKKEVLGRMNLAFLFALSQFFVAWGLAFFYVKAAARWDQAAAAVRTRFDKG
ncbi:MAG: hypothetical protein QOE70_4177 [Chthoniobacter sp.]|jgi:uncharacterized membrane protein (DUF485 family)|nr:hypothetical protein [Chthoniobacter sp.]